MERGEFFFFFFSFINLIVIMGWRDLNRSHLLWKHKGVLIELQDYWQR